MIIEFSIIEYFVCSLHRLYCYVVVFNIKVKYARIFVYETFILRVPLPDNDLGSQIQIQKYMLYTVHCTYFSLFTVHMRCILDIAIKMHHTKCIFESAVTFMFVWLMVESHAICFTSMVRYSLYCNMCTRKIQMIFFFLGGPLLVISFFLSYMQWTSLFCL